MHKARMLVVCAGLLALLLPRTAAAAWPSDSTVNAPICTADGSQQNFTRASVSDGAGGAIVIWQDRRSGGYGNEDIYAQRISADSTPMWTASGVALCTADISQLGPRITSAGAGGAIVTPRSTDR